MYITLLQNKILLLCLRGVNMGENIEKKATFKYILIIINFGLAA